MRRPAVFLLAILVLASPVAFAEPGAQREAEPVPECVYGSHVRSPERNWSEAPSWSADGRWLAVLRKPGIQTGTPVLVETRGSRRVFLPRIRRTRLRRAPLRFAWAPRGVALIVYSDSEIHLVRPGRAARHVARGCFGAWSPDGRRIAFTFRGQAYISSPDGSRRRVVARADYVDDWARDGRRLLLARRFLPDARCRFGRSRIFVLRLSNGRLTPVTDDTVVRNGSRLRRWDQGPASFSPDGRQIAFAEGQPCGLETSEPDPAVYVASLSSRALRLVDRGLPFWAPRRNVLVVYRPGTRGFSVVDERYRRSEFDRGGFIFYDPRPSPSPDGRRVVFSFAVGHGSHKVHIAPAGRPSGAAVFAQDAWAPSWSPDGGRIAFSGRSNGCTEAVFVAPANGGARRLLLPCL